MLIMDFDGFFVVNRQFFSRFFSRFTPNSRGTLPCPPLPYMLIAEPTVRRLEIMIRNPAELGNNSEANAITAV
jgi:hypothetical protein